MADVVHLYASKPLLRTYFSSTQRLPIDDTANAHASLLSCSHVTSPRVPWIKREERRARNTSYKEVYNPLLVRSLLIKFLKCQKSFRFCESESNNYQLFQAAERLDVFDQAPF